MRRPFLYKQKPLKRWATCVCPGAVNSGNCGVMAGGHKIPLTVGNFRFIFEHCSDVLENAEDFQSRTLKTEKYKYTKSVLS